MFSYICSILHVSLYSRALFVCLFNGLNFSDRCVQVQFDLNVFDLDLALQVKKPLLLLVGVAMIKRLSTKLVIDRTG